MAALLGANSSTLSAQNPLLSDNFSYHLEDPTRSSGEATTDSPDATQTTQTVTEAIREASRRTGVDYNYLLATAHLESGLDPQAAAKTSSARGLYQFIETTWLASLSRHASEFDLTPTASEMGDVPQFIFAAPKSRQSLLDMRTDPRLAALIAAAETKENKKELQRVLGDDVSNADLYLAHFLGSSGASRFLRAWKRNPHTRAAHIFPRAARANRSVFYARSGRARSLDAVRSLIAAKIERTTRSVGAANWSNQSRALTNQNSSMNQSAECASSENTTPFNWPSESASAEPENARVALTSRATHISGRAQLALRAAPARVSTFIYENQCNGAELSERIAGILAEVLTPSAPVSPLLAIPEPKPLRPCDHIEMWYMGGMSTSTITRVRELVNSGEMTRAGLARAAGLHANTLRDASEGDWNPTAETLQKLEVFLDSNEKRPALVGIEEIIDEARNGRMYILVDDEDRENEGDLIIPAQMATPAAINFMATHGRGLICLALDKQRVDELGLEPMSRNNKESMQTAFTISIEAKDGVTTGISAADRARTVSVAIDSTKGADDIVTPGHVFPLAARNGGTLVRAGHTEAAVDISRLAGLNPSGVICEIMNEDGTMARLEDLIEFARIHDLKIGTIRDLIAYRMRNDHLVERLSENSFESDYGGHWRLITYRDRVANDEAYVLQKGRVIEGEATLARVHPISVFDDVLGAPGPRQNTLQRSMSAIGEKGSGVIVILTSRVGSGGEWTSDEELRNIGIGSQILADLGVHDMVLLSNSRPDLVALEGYGISITDFQSIPE